MAPVDGHFYRVSARFKDVRDNDIMNVFALRYDETGGGASSSDILTAALLYVNNVFAEIGDRLSNTQSPFDVKVDRMDVIGGKFEVVESIGTANWSNPAICTDAGDPLPPGVAALINLRSTRPKSFGRKFFGQITEGNQANGVLGASLVTDLTGCGGKILTNVAVAVSAGTLEPIILSLYGLNGWLDLTEAIVSDVVAYQRRRRQGTGS